MTHVHYDIIGSFLRPEELKVARAAFEAGEISQEQLKEVEDKAILELIQKQKEAGLKIITDGEFRRSWWHYDFFWGLEGLYKYILPAESVIKFKGINLRPEAVGINGKLGGKNHPFIQHFKFLKEHTPEGLTPKLSIPAPAQLLKNFFVDNYFQEDNGFYQGFEDFTQDLIKAYLEFVQEFKEAGGTFLQFDDCSWGVLTDDRDLEKVNRFGGADKLAAAFVTANNRVYENVPQDIETGTHVCRGNFRSHYHFEGSYEKVADHLIGQEKVDQFFLEYDDEGRIGDFEPLRKWNGQSQVVLGLITSKTPDLEDKEQVIARIKEASKFVPLEKISLSTQCGFSSTEEGNDLTYDQQWAKIALVKEIADQVWGEK